jgi:glycosyltransferase involved in cell wall biosynthesis
VSTTLLVVAQNEIEGMRAIMPKVDRQWCDQILVLDGRSTDGTAEYARQQGYDVHVQSRPGLRAAYQEVWPLIRGDHVITFSPDGNSPPEYIPMLITKIREGYDMVLFRHVRPCQPRAREVSDIPHALGGSRLVDARCPGAVRADDEA